MVSKVSQATITALLDILARDYIKASVHDLFLDHDFSAVDGAPEGTSERRNIAMTYLHGLKLSDPRDIKRLIPLFDEVLGEMEDYNGEPEPLRVRLYNRLTRDGFVRGEDGKLRASGSMPLAELSAPLLDVDVLREHITRLAAALDQDSSIVIGSSKDLIESACKVVLTRTNTPFTEDDKMPALVKRAQNAIGLDPAAVEGTDQAQASVRRILSALASLGVGIAELRNELGGGHGRAEVIHLPQRHAHLAAGGAITFARMLLETLEDEKAPWRTSKLPTVEA